MLEKAAYGIIIRSQGDGIKIFQSLRLFTLQIGLCIQKNLSVGADEPYLRILKVGEGGQVVVGIFQGCLLYTSRCV